MSVMTVDLQNVANIETTLMRGGYFENGHANCLHWQKDWCYYGNNKITPLQDFLIRLVRLNYISYCYRYRETNWNSKKYACLLNFNRGKLTNDFQLLKSLECIHYNIEGEKVEKRKETKQLEKLINLLKSLIIHKNEKYQNAYWG